METYTTIRSPGAIALGLFFAAVTGGVLFQDVLQGAPITSNHALTLAAIVAALASAHYAWPQLRAWALMPGLTLIVLFLASTAYVVVSSGARNAETYQAKAARITANNGDRARAEAEYRATVEEIGRIGAVRTTQAVRAAMDAAPVARDVFRRTAQCTDMTRADSFAACKPILDLRQEMASAIRKAELEIRRDAARAALEHMGPALDANGGYAHAAKVIAALPGVTAAAASIEDRLTLLLPFVVVVIAELGTICFLHMGFGHKRRKPSPPLPPPATVSTVSAATVETKPPARSSAGSEKPGQHQKPGKPRPGNRPQRPLTRKEAEAFVVTQIALQGTLPSQDWLAERCGVRKGTISKWLADWERRGTVTRARTGRCNVIEGSATEVS